MYSPRIHKQHVAHRHRDLAQQILRCPIRHGSAKLRRANASTGLPAHQSAARKPPAFPEAEDATSQRSTTVTLITRRARK